MQPPRPSCASCPAQALTGRPRLRSGRQVLQLFRLVGRSPAYFFFAAAFFFGAAFFAAGFFAAAFFAGFFAAAFFATAMILSFHIPTPDYQLSVGSIRGHIPRPPIPVQHTRETLYAGLTPRKPRVSVWRITFQKCLRHTWHAIIAKRFVRIVSAAIVVAKTCFASLRRALFLFARAPRVVSGQVPFPLRFNFSVEFL